MLKKIPHTYTIIFSIILLCAVLSWIIPAGEYSRHTVEVNGTTRSVIVDNSYHAVESVPQTWQVFSALLQGFEKQAGIIAFLLIIGGAFQIMNNSRAIDVGIFSFLRFTQGLERHRFMKRIGVNNLVIAMIIFLFSMFGAVFGMSEETLAFVIIIVPLAISMGYDSITGLCMVYVAAHVGFAGAILNPFTIGIAQGLSGLPLFSGFEYRLFCWFLLTVILVACVLIYAARVKRNPTLSPMYRADEYWRNRRTESGEEVAYTIPVASYIVYGLILVSLIIFAVVYPVTTFSLGNASVTFYAVPVGTVLFALFGWLGLRKSFHFFILSILAFTRNFGDFSGDGSVDGVCCGQRYRQHHQIVSRRSQRYLIGGYCGRTGRRYHPDFAGRAYYRSYITCLGFPDERGRKSGFGWCDVCNSDADQYHYPFGIGQSCFDDADYGSLLGCHRYFPAGYSDGFPVR